MKNIGHQAGRARQRICTAVGLAIVAAGITAIILAPPAQAASSDSLYSYTLDGSNSSIPNAAATNTNVAMTLTGSWSQSGIGIHFAGNTTNQQSAGYAKPLSGKTVNIAASQAVGAGIYFTYHAPTSGTCFSDSPNVSQIGFFAAKTAQIKLQLSKCSISSTQVFPQCRMAGSLTAGNVLPVTGSTALVDNTSYILTCVKSPDPSKGNATLELNLTKIDATNGNQTYSNTFSIPRTGTISSSQYLSVGAKYPLAAQANNTDQFVGEIGKVAYCASANLNAARTCVNDEIPVPASAL